MQQIRTRTRPGPPQEPHAHHPAPAQPRHQDDPALRAAVPGEKGFNMKVIQRMVLKTRSTRVAATCSDESSSSGRLFGGVWMRLPGAMRRIVERWGAEAGRDDPFESPPGVLEGVGRGGVGGLVVRGGSGAARTVPDDHPGRSRRAQRPQRTRGRLGRAEPAGPADLSLPELLALTVEGALDACADLPKVRRRLQLLVDLGLGYLALGETTTALSGGGADGGRVVAMGAPPQVAAAESSMTGRYLAARGATLAP